MLLEDELRLGTGSTSGGGGGGGCCGWMRRWGAFPLGGGWLRWGWGRRRNAENNAQFVAMYVHSGKRPKYDTEDGRPGLKLGNSEQERWVLRDHVFVLSAV